MQRLLSDAQELTGVEYDINNLGDVYDAIHVIQGELGLTGVAADEASGTLTGSFAAVKANYLNLIGSLAIGEDIQAPLNGLVTSISTFAFQNLIPMIGNIIRALPGAIVTFIRQGVPMLLTNISALVTSVANSAKQFASGITSERIRAWAQTMLPKMAASAGKILGGFIKGIGQNAGKIALAIGKIGLAVVKGLGSALWGKVTQAANGIKDRFLAPINTLRERVRAIIDRIKGFFSFHVSSPHIPLPHFAISPAGWKLSDLLKGTKPSLSISWYKEGGIFDRPTLVPGIGEAGPEAVVPLNTLWAKMDAIARSVEQRSGGGQLNVAIMLDGKIIGQAAVDYINDETIMFGTSPLAV